MHLTLFGEVQLFLLIAVTSASFLYWINHKYKSLNRQIIRAIDIPVYLLNRQGIVVKLLNTPTEKANRLPFLNSGVLNINNLVTDADECRKYMTSLLRVLNTRTSDSLILKIRVESSEELYIAVRMVYLNRNYAMAFIRDITEDEVQRRENERKSRCQLYSGERFRILVRNTLSTCRKPTCIEKPATDMNSVNSGQPKPSPMLS